MFKTISNTENCPNCGAEALPDNNQPQPSLHAFSTVFKCGCMIDMAFGSNEYTFSTPCTDAREATPKVGIRHTEKEDIECP